MTMIDLIAKRLGFTDGNLTVLTTPFKGYIFLEVTHRGAESDPRTFTTHNFMMDCTGFLREVTTPFSMNLPAEC